MSADVNESPITVVRTAVLEFLEEMKKNRRLVEQEIRDQTDAVLTSFFNQGLSQFSRTDIQEFNKKHREAFIDYYKNTIYLRIISNASAKIRSAIEEGFNNPGIIQDEWMKGISDVQNQLSHMQELAESVQEYKKKIDEQSQIISELSSTSTMSSSDLELYQNALEERDNLIIERDQIIREKDTEIQNLTQGLQHMEEQSNNLGQSLLEYNMNIEELQEGINNRDETIEDLKAQLKSNTSSSQEVEILKTQLAESEATIRRLQQEVSTGGGDLVNELQETLEKTRSQLLEIRREIVQKNDKIHDLELNKDELEIQNKNTKEKLETNSVMVKELKTEIQGIKTTNDELKSELEKSKSIIDTTQSKIEKLQTDLDLATEKLETYEGKVSISAEEKDKISSQVSTLKEKMKDNENSLGYLTDLVKSDIKFRVLFFLQTLDAETRIDSLAQGVGVPVNVVHRILVELSKEDQVKTRKDGRYIFAEATAKNSPFALVTNL